MKPINVSVYVHGDTSLGFSCGDCPSSPVCSTSAPPLHKKQACSIRVGSIQLYFIDRFHIYENAPGVIKGLHLPLVQDYMSIFYRRYGTWVVGNPSLVLCSSLDVVLILCLGLIYFKVETRPEKVVFLGYSAKRRITAKPVTQTEN